MKHLENELPHKLKIRDEIQQWFKLTKRLNTLVTINNERKLTFLEKQRDVINNDQVQLIKTLNEKAKEIQDNILQVGQIELERKNIEELIDLTYRDPIISLGRPLEGPAQNCTVQTSYIELKKMTASLHTSAVESLEQLEEQIDVNGELQAEISENLGQLAAIDWKISLSEVKNTDKDEFEKRLEMFTWLLAAEESRALQTSKDIEATDMEIKENRTKVIEWAMKDFEGFETQIKELRQAQLSFVKQSLAVDGEILRNMKNTIATKLEINVVAMMGGFNSSYVNTLLEIEAFIMMDPNLSADYHGPIFQYLEAPSDLERIVWPQLSTIATTFLFTRGSTARKVNRLLLQSKKNLGCYVFLGIDEFVPRTTGEVPEEQIEIINEAESLVRSDARLGNILKTLMREAVLSKKVESSAQQFVCSRNAGRFFSSLDCLSMESSLPMIKIDDHILYLQNIYNFVKEHASLLAQIMKSRVVKHNLEQMLKTMDDDIESLRKQALKSLPVAALKKSTELLQIKSDQTKRHSDKKSYYQNLHAMKNISENINLWIIDELEQAKLQKLLELQRNKKEMDFRKRTERGKVTETMTIVTAGMRLMTRCLDILSHTQSHKAEFTELLKKNLETNDEGNQATRRKFLKPSKTASIATNLQIDLMELRCRLFGKNSERDCVDHAIELCNLPDNFDEKLYQAMREENVAADIYQCQQQLKAQKSSKQLSLLSKDYYVHLVQSIGNVSRYNEAADPIISRNQLVAKSFPLLNKFAVKALKDAVYNYRTSFANVMEDYVRKSSLLFYTRGTFDEVSEDQFSWNSFDLGRLKALDFIMKWKRDCRENVSSTSLSKIKALLLIAHVINYLSIFKFIIIDESFYDVSALNIIFD